MNILQAWCANILRTSDTGATINIKPREAHRQNDISPSLENESRIRDPCLIPQCHIKPVTLETLAHKESHLRIRCRVSAAPPRIRTGRRLRLEAPKARFLAIFSQGLEMNSAGRDRAQQSINKLMKRVKVTHFRNTYENALDALGLSGVTYRIVLEF